MSRDTEIREARLKIEDLMQKLSEARSEINAANLTSSEESIKLRNLEVALDFAQNNAKKKDEIITQKDLELDAAREKIDTLHFELEVSIII